MNIYTENIKGLSLGFMFFKEKYGYTILIGLVKKTLVIHLDKVKEE